MPELPEVETTKNELSPHVVGHRITGVTLFWDRVVRQPSVAEFCSGIIGQEITGIARRGKYLILSLSSGDLLVIHLKMSGSLLLKPSSAPPEKFTRAIIYLDNETAIVLRDPRKFAMMQLVKDDNHIASKLGPEHWSLTSPPEFWRSAWLNEKHR